MKKEADQSHIIAITMVEGIANVLIVTNSNTVCIKKA